MNSNRLLQLEKLKLAKTLKEMSDRISAMKDDPAFPSLSAFGQLEHDYQDRLAEHRHQIKLCGGAIQTHVSDTYVDDIDGDITALLLKVRDLIAQMTHPDACSLQLMDFAPKKGMRMIISADQDYLPEICTVISDNLPTQLLVEDFMPVKPELHTCMGLDNPDEGVAYLKAQQTSQDVHGLVDMPMTMH